MINYDINIARGSAFHIAVAINVCSGRKRKVSDLKNSVLD
jgi:hypothetical protein